MSSSINITVFFVLGGPGCGKGTHCNNLANEFGLIHLSVGEILRKEMNNSQSKHSQLINSCINAGSIVPINITIDLIQNKMQSHIADGNYLFLIDGFPRNYNNFNGWNQIMNSNNKFNVNIPFLLYLQCYKKIMKQRILSRKRSDDNLETFDKRYQIFKNETLPIIAEYKKTKQCKTVNTNGEMDVIYNKIKKLFVKYFKDRERIEIRKQKDFTREKKQQKRKQQQMNKQHKVKNKKISRKSKQTSTVPWKSNEYRYYDESHESSTDSDEHYCMPIESEQKKQYNTGDTTYNKIVHQTQSQVHKNTDKNMDNQRVNSDEAVHYLLSMGFPASKALNAYIAANYDINIAVKYLLNEHYYEQSQNNSVHAMDHEIEHKICEDEDNNYSSDSSAKRFESPNDNEKKYNKNTNNSYNDTNSNKVAEEWWSSITNIYNCIANNLYNYTKNKNGKKKHKHHNTYHVERHESGCIDGDGLVLMVNGHHKKISDIKAGDKVCSFPNNVSTVECVMISVINKPIKMVRLENDKNGTYFWITYKHPILIDTDTDGSIMDNNKYNDLNLSGLDVDEISKYNLKWIFPSNMCPQQLKYETVVYNFLLDSNHTINVNGYWCVTLGDDYIKGDGIGHKLWGNSVAVKKFLNYRSSS